MTLLGEPESSRSVRMILLEWIRGVSMQALIDNGEFQSIAPQRRLDILAKAIEAETRLTLYGVRHLDLTRRNIILVDLDILHRKQVPEVVRILRQLKKSRCSSQASA